MNEEVEMKANRCLEAFYPFHNNHTNHLLQPSTIFVQLSSSYFENKNRHMFAHSERLVGWSVLKEVNTSCFYKNIDQAFSGTSKILISSSTVSLEQLNGAL